MVAVRAGLLPWLAQLAAQVLPEPVPERPYLHPSQYSCVVPGVRHYSDGMHKRFRPSLCTVAVSAVTLGAYCGVPHLLLGLAIAAVAGSRVALWVLLALLASLLVPARPLRVPSVLCSRLFLCWRRYFTFSYLFERSLDPYQDYVIAQFPHGAFPLGALVGGTFMASEYPEYHCYALAASSAFLVPIWRHVHAWLGTAVCTKTQFHRLLARGVNGPLRHHHHHHQPQPHPQQQEPGDTALNNAAGGSGCTQAHATGLPAAAACTSSKSSSHGHSSNYDTHVPLQRGSTMRQRRGCAADLPHTLSGRLAVRRLSAVGSGALSTVASLAASLRGGHTLSDSESSESDAASCADSEASGGCSSELDAAGGGSAAAANAAAGEPAPLQPSPFGQLQHQQERHAQMLAAVQHDSTPEQRGWRIDPTTGQRKTGVSVGLLVGGIAEMFMIRPDHERIKLRERKGFVRIALQHGTPILPVYIFGANQLLDFGPPWLHRCSRKLRASLGIIYGCWGLPIPRRLPIFMVTGAPLEVGCAMPKDAPGFDARVDELHAAFCEEIQRLYYTHRSTYGRGFEDRPLVIC